MSNSFGGTSGLVGKSAVFGCKSDVAAPGPTEAPKRVKSMIQLEKYRFYGTPLYVPIRDTAAVENQ